MGSSMTLRTVVMLGAMQILFTALRGVNTTVNTSERVSSVYFFGLI